MANPRTPEQIEAEALLRKLGGKMMGGSKIAENYGLQQDINNGPERVETSGTGLRWDDEVNRFQGMGAASHGRAAPQLDQTQANESRGMQMGALGLLQRQADGSAASSAEILSQRANQNAATQAAQSATAARGLGSRLVAQNTAGTAAAGQALAGNAANANARAAEISRGQSQYTAGAGAVRGQDIGAATQNAKLVAQQRALNEAREQGMERLAHDTRTTELEAGMEAQAQHDERVAEMNRRIAAAKASKEAAVTQAFGTVSSMGAGALGAGLSAKKMTAAKPQQPKPTDTSDERAKTSIRPMGSLGHLMRGR